MRHGFCSLLVALSASASLYSTTPTVDHRWTGNGNADWLDPKNWVGGTIPDDVNTARAVFGPHARHTFLYHYAVGLQGLSFQGINQDFFLQGSGYGLRLGSGGLVYQPASDFQSVIRDYVQLEANQTWNIAAGSFKIDGSINDVHEGNTTPYTLEKTGAGTLILGNAASSDWEGGLTLTGGKVVIGPNYEGTNYALGKGTLTFNGGTLVADSSYGQDEATVSNHIHSNGTLNFDNRVALRLASAIEGGQGISLSTNTTLSSTGKTLFIDGDIDGAYKLTINGSGMVVLSGNNTYSGGTLVEKGILIFRNAASVPHPSPGANTLRLGALGYAGYASTEDFKNNFFDYFHPGQSLGTIGFDTDPDFFDETGQPNEFTQNLNLSGALSFQTTRLGSATIAIYSGTLTPADGRNYRFGGGGGHLIVASSLSGTGNVNVTSPDTTPLTLRLTGDNSISGGIHAEQSAVVFAQSSALPASGNLSAGLGGYFGFAYDPETSIATDFLSRFSTLAPGSIIGFDSADIYQTLRSLTADIDLSAAKFAGVYLGTSSALALNGTLTPNGSTYRFAAYKGGTLTLNSLLSGDNAVIVGHPDVQGTVGDRNAEELSTVIFANAANSYTGGTTLYPAHIIVDGPSGEVTNAFGTGPLTIGATNIDFDGEAPSVLLTPNRYDLTVPNAIALNADLEIGGFYSYDNSAISLRSTSGSSIPEFTLSGTISGRGELYIGGDNPVALSLTGNNTYSGGTYLKGGSALFVGSDTATGSGPLRFGSSGSGVTFETAAPVVGGLDSDGAYVSLLFNAAAPVFTINQTTDGQFHGQFRNDEYQTLRVVKAGAGTLTLGNGSFYPTNGTPEPSLPGTPSVGLQVTAGTLVFTSGFSINETPTIWVNGGTLFADGNPTISNPLIVDNGGTLAGSGRFNSTVIGVGATLSPGHASTGHLGSMEFTSHLEFAAGGTYEWNISSALADGFNYQDAVFVGSPKTLEISATAADRFTLRVVSLNLLGELGQLSDIDPAHGTYSWTLVSGLSLTGSADFLNDPNSVFNLDTTGFNAGVSGTFIVAAHDESIVLQFVPQVTPVPEPSTYALLAIGLGLVGLAAWRRRPGSHR